METISVLLITEYEKEYEHPSYVEIKSLDDHGENDDSFDITIVDRDLSDDEYLAVLEASQAHRVYTTDSLTDSVKKAEIIKSKCAKELPADNVSDFLNSESKYFYKKPYGEKYRFTNLTVSRNFMGKVTYEGNNRVNLEGNFGDKLSQALYFRNNIPIYAGQEIDFWIEYEKTGSVKISLEIVAYKAGATDKVFDRREYSEEELREVVTYGNLTNNVSIFVSIKASGEGSLSFIALHDRFSRGKNGAFLIGGERYVTSKREEIFAYFEPGDLKPPLSIYFSGYKTREGFEGQGMMKRLGGPFLLISEARLEGGGFYIGDDEYEKLLLRIIRDHLKILGFDDRDVIMSGLSMGSYGALYYACDLRPDAVIVGKPLANIGSIAANEQRFRPGGFATSIDVLKKNTGDTGRREIELINNKIWSKYELTDWSSTKFVVAYMIEDDYDAKAYSEMISRLNGAGATIYGKGIHGRHNDNTGGIVNWFVGQFEEVLSKDYQRSFK